MLGLLHGSHQASDSAFMNHCFFYLYNGDNDSTFIIKTVVRIQHPLEAECVSLSLIPNLYIETLISRNGLEVESLKK